MAEFTLLDNSEPIRLGDRVALVPKLFRIHPDDPDEEPRLVYSVQKYREITDIQGNTSWQDANQALWFMGTPESLAKKFETVGQGLRDLEPPEARPDSSPNEG